MSNFGSSQDYSEKSPMPVEKIRTPSKKVRDGCSHFVLVTHTYKTEVESVQLENTYIADMEQCP